MNCVAHVVRMQFAVDAGFPHAPGNELGVLGTEVEDENFFVHMDQGSGIRGQERKSRALRDLP